MEKKEAIFQLIKDKNPPASIRELYNEAELSWTTLKQILNTLIEEKKIEEIERRKKYSDGTIRATKYYIERKDVSGEDLKKLNRIVAEETIASKENAEELKDKCNKLEKRIDSVYANFISIMGIFISIFSIISIDSKIVFDISKSNIEISKVILATILINITGVISILAVILFIKMLLSEIVNKKE